MCAQVVQPDEHYMARALRLARHGLTSTHPNPRVGCVIVRDGEIVGEGWHVRAGEPHAEIFALREAGARARGAAMYVTLEPCCHHGRTPPCVDALMVAGIARVVIAMQDPNAKVAGKGIAQLRSAGMVVDVGVLQQEAEALNRGFMSRMTRRRPWVRVKLAASMDGRTTAANGASQWITGPAARADVHSWRAQSDAILTGIGTVLADDPALTARDGDTLLPRQPVRIVLDTHARLPADARILRQPGLVWQVHSGAHVATTAAHSMIAPLQSGRIDLAYTMQMLADREINDVWVEAGPILSGALVAAGLVDELMLYFAPHVLGDGGRGMFTLPLVQSLQDRKQITLRDVRCVGEDLRITATMES
jgi:diaminohydroxyphosphoribosylaminopyrimidine deaminase / 5-amino-6-(5-phosphoribosylamino)uracil reductase